MVIVLVEPVPVAVTPAPTKFNNEAAVANDVPSSATDTDDPPPPVGHVVIVVVLSLGYEPLFLYP